MMANPSLHPSSDQQSRSTTNVNNLTVSTSNNKNNSNTTTTSNINSPLCSKSNNLLSPNAAFDHQKQASSLGAGYDERRKSTLSANGFFLDYSSIRRRSSAAVQALKIQQQQKILNQYVSPKRWPRGGSMCVTGSNPVNWNISQPCSPSRTSSYSQRGHSASFLLPGSALLNTQNALAGSRKTSIFDPTGHSLVPHPQANRRKSTMVTTMGAPYTSSSNTDTNLLGVAIPQTNPTMLSVAKRAASGDFFRHRRSTLAQHVPVIGCSPTSIQASLNVLDETRRYEKLLRRLERHKQSKQKRRRRQLKTRRLRQLGCSDHSDESSYEHQGSKDSRPRLDIRRKSIRAIKDAATLLSMRRRRERNNGLDDSERNERLSISTMSLIDSISSSLSSLDGYELDNDELFYDDNTLINPNEPTRRPISRSTSSLNLPIRSMSGEQREEVRAREDVRKSRTNKKSFMKSAMNKLFNYIGSPNSNRINMSRTISHELESRPMQTSPTRTSPMQRFSSVEDNAGPSTIDSDHIMAKAKGDPRTGSPIGIRAKNMRRRRQSRRSMTISGGMNYLYYYYYLRESSVDAIDDLPVQSVAGLGINSSGLGNITKASMGGLGANCGLSGGVGAGDVILSDAERKARLHINYSLARINILNSRSDPKAKLASRMAALADYNAITLNTGLSNINGSSLGLTEGPSGFGGRGFSSSMLMANSIQPQQGEHDDQQQQQHHLQNPQASPLLFDYSQSSDSSSLILSTTSSSSGASADLEDESIQRPRKTSRKAAQLRAQIDTRESDGENTKMIGGSAIQYSIVDGVDEHVESKLRFEPDESELVIKGSSEVATNHSWQEAGSMSFQSESIESGDSFDRCAGSDLSYQSHRQRQQQQQQQQQQYPQQYNYNQQQHYQQQQYQHQHENQSYQGYPQQGSRNQLTDSRTQSTPVASLPQTSNGSFSSGGSVSFSGPNSTNQTYIGTSGMTAITTEGPYPQTGQEASTTPSSEQQHKSSCRSTNNQFKQLHGCDNTSSKYQGFPKGSNEFPRHAIESSTVQSVIEPCSSQSARDLSQPNDCSGQFGGALVSQDSSTYLLQQYKKNPSSSTVVTSQGSHGSVVHSQGELPHEDNIGFQIQRWPTEQGSGSSLIQAGRSGGDYAAHTIKTVGLSNTTTTTTSASHYLDDNEEELDDFEKLERRHSSYRYKIAQLEVEQMRKRERQLQREKELKRRQSSKGSSKGSKTKGSEMNQEQQQQQFSSDLSFHSASETGDGSIKTRRRRRRKLGKVFTRGSESRASVKSTASCSNSCGLNSFKIGNLFGRIARVSMSWDALAGSGTETTIMRDREDIDREPREFHKTRNIGRHSLKQPRSNRLNEERTKLVVDDSIRGTSTKATATNDYNLGSVSLIVPEKRAWQSMRRATDGAKAMRKTLELDHHKASKSNRASGENIGFDDPSIATQGSQHPSLLFGGNSVERSKQNKRESRLSYRNRVAMDSGNLSGNGGGDLDDESLIVKQSSIEMKGTGVRNLQETLDVCNLEYELNSDNNNGIRARAHSTGASTASSNYRSPNEPNFESMELTMKIAKGLCSSYSSQSDKFQLEQQQPMACSFGGINLMGKKRGEVMEKITSSEGKAQVKLTTKGSEQNDKLITTRNKVELTLGRSSDRGSILADTKQADNNNRSSSDLGSDRLCETSLGSSRGAIQVDGRPSSAGSRPRNTWSSASAGPYKLNRGQRNSSKVRQSLRDRSDKCDPEQDQDSIEDPDGEDLNGQVKDGEPIDVHKCEEDDEDEKDEEETLRLLEKSCFVCSLVGSRQTGKRTIVKCFVKLLNEFKLVAGEYKKEKILTKLMDCAERIQKLQSEQEEQQQQQQQQQLQRTTNSNSSDIGYDQDRSARKRSISQWISGGAVNRLLNLPSVVGSNKRRVNSMIPQNRPIELDEKGPYERRHTTIEPPRFLIHRSSRPDVTDSSLNIYESDQQHRSSCNINNEEGDECQESNQRDDMSKFLCDKQTSESSSSKHHESNNESTKYLTVSTSLKARCNKSDTNINYANESYDLRMSISNENESSKNLQNKTNEDRERASDSYSSDDRVSMEADDRNNKDCKGSVLSPSSSSLMQNLNEQQRSIRSRKDSIKLINEARLQRNKPFLSLKELNRRRIRIKFKTRRRLNEAYFGDHKSSADHHRGSRRVEYPDSFMIVYSINDRDSFEYAKSLVKQLKSTKKGKIIPMILVANKVDLERAKVVKTEEGRSFASRYGCKFMETSCTIGFNLDNLLVGLRTQLVLRHHLALNSVFQNGKYMSDSDNDAKTRGQINKDEGAKEHKAIDIIIRKLRKRYFTDGGGQEYDCDNFSKL